MDVKAVLLVGAPHHNHSHVTESIAGIPIALLPVLGRPVVQQVARHLRRWGVEDIRVISDARSASASIERHAQSVDFSWTKASGEKIWNAAEDCVTEFIQAGAELILVIRLGAYLEFNLDDVIQFHFDQDARVTRISDETQAYDYFVVGTSRRRDAASLLRDRLQPLNVPCRHYIAPSYANPLATAKDLRRLAQDSLLTKTHIVPDGEQVRPGVWLGKGAKIERGARVVAPAYVGERAIVRAAALITRCSTIEHHAEIDCGTIVEDSSVLPYASVGAGLEVAHSTVAFRQLTNHRRDITIEIVDPMLLNMVPERVLSRAKARIAAWLRGERHLQRPERRRAESQELRKLQAFNPALDSTSSMEPAVAEGSIPNDSVNY